jgi:hypothetical protein
LKGILLALVAELHSDYAEMSVLTPTPKLPSEFPAARGTNDLKQEGTGLKEDSVGLQSYPKVITLLFSDRCFLIT